MGAPNISEMTSKHFNTLKVNKDLSAIFKKHPIISFKQTKNLRGRMLFLTKIHRKKQK